MGAGIAVDTALEYPEGIKRIKGTGFPAGRIPSSNRPSRCTAEPAASRAR